MTVPLIFTAVLFMFSAAMLFDSKFLATGWMSVAIGLAYFSWGAYNTHGKLEVNPSEPQKMWLGVGLVAFGLLLLALNWFFNIRREMPRR